MDKLLIALCEGTFTKSKLTMLSLIFTALDIWPSSRNLSNHPMVETLHNSTYISSYRSLRIAFPIIYILKDTFQFRIHKLTLVSLFPLSKIKKVKYLTQKCDINMYYIVVLLKNWSECHRISCEDTILDSLAPTAYVGW